MAAESTSSMTIERQTAQNEVMDELAAGIRRMWFAVSSGVRQDSTLDGLHPQQFWVIAMARDRNVRMSEIADALHTTQANVTGVVDRLEERGLVKRVRDQRDRRVVHVSITKDGLEALRVLRETFREQVERVLAPLSDAERAQLAALCAKALGDTHPEG